MPSRTRTQSPGPCSATNRFELEQIKVSRISRRQKQKKTKNKRTTLEKRRKGLFNNYETCWPKEQTNKMDTKVSVVDQWISSLQTTKNLFLSFDQILTVFVASILKQKSTKKKRKKKDAALWIFSFDYYFSNLFCDVVMNRFNVTPVGDSKRGGLIRDARKVAQRTREWEKTIFFFPTRLHHHRKFVLNHTYTLSQLFAF